ncbi:hypothetical protein PLICRDRAFT_177644 [Plicaturopsis crispa FD-325 SS-3]|nr:hypothetical protein PLICRDRAFT_177644 [Plicaturopsis crispa FD-325 SS-3]
MAFAALRMLSPRQTSPYEITEPTKEDLVLYAAPYLLGSIFNWALLGCLNVQIYIYSISNKNDRTSTKILVYGVYAIDIVQTAFATYTAWLQLVWAQGNYESLTDFNWSVCLTPIFAGIVSCGIQLFFARRIWILKNTSIMRKLVVCIVVLAVVQCGSAVAYAIMGLTNTPFSANQVLSALVIWLPASFFCDVIIAGSLLHILRRARSQTPIKATETILTRLIVVTIQTGFITAVVAGLQLLSYILCFVTESQYYIMFSFVLGKLYSNVLLATLNARAVVVRVADNEVSTVAMKTSQGIVFRVEPASDSSQATVLSAVVSQNKPAEDPKEYLQV